VGGGGGEGGFASGIDGADSAGVWGFAGVGIEKDQGQAVT